LPIAPYTGASYGTFENRMLYPFSLNVAIGAHWSAMLMNDGVHTHVSATYAWNRFAGYVSRCRAEGPRGTSWARAF
jgi:hypothetical protein